MIQPSRPDNWQELMAGYVLGDLSSQEAETFKRLLESDPDLILEVNQFQEVLALMPYALPEQDPPEHLRSAILDAAQTSPQSPEPLQRNRPRFLRSILLGTGTTVAALLIATLLTENQRLRRELRDTKSILQALQQPDTALHTLTGTGVASAASGRVLVDMPQRSVVVLVQNLPQLPEGKAYRLWVVTEGKSEPYYCGQFTAATGGQVATHWVLPEECDSQVNQLLITAEFAADPPVPAGPLVMKSVN